MNDNYSIQEIIEIAIEIEKNGELFYRTLSEYANTSKLRELFDYLSKEEKSHIAKFGKILSSAGGYQISEVYYATNYMGYMKAIADERVFKSDTSAIEFARSMKKPEEAINAALGFEKESVLFLHELEAILSDSEDKEPIRRLLNEEREHIRKLSELKTQIG